ncbi:MAG: glutamate--cysteine ligase [Colwellia sp.]
MSSSLQNNINYFNSTEHLASLKGIGRGIERETLRILPEGKLSQAPHAYQLGAALTHGQITTDYSETLLEFITPVSKSPEQAIAQLQDIQKYTFSVIGEELLWPMSMPCFVSDANSIPLANYGQSNIGKMKTVYRQGLKNRYGSMMQIIAGIHFNFSFPETFWEAFQTLENNADNKTDYISDKYLATIRNYKRFCWLIPYLYGSSPSLCPSFLGGKEHSLPFKKSKTGELYLDYATSLRMSDLGYTASEQSSLEICYNNLNEYVDGVQNAIALKSKDFSAIGIKVNGEYQQLNDNVLQIENELYAPIRPKRVAKSGEKPSHALRERGIEYIEVRALDVNPFVETGISLEQVHFLDVFLMFCALTPSDELDFDAQKIHEQNMDEVVLRGRDPELLLKDVVSSSPTDAEGLKHRSVKEWGNELFKQMALVAELLDKAYETTSYSEAIECEQAKINNPALTPSAKLLEITLDENTNISKYALHQAALYRDKALDRPYQYYSEDEFKKNTEKSHLEQKKIEESDKLSFDDFLSDYFNH